MRKLTLAYRSGAVNRRRTLQNLQDQTFQIFALCQPQEDRMVGSLASLGRQPQGPARVSAGFPEKTAKLLDAEVMRAGTGDQEASGTEQAHGAQVDFLVTRHGLLQTASRFDECGRIQDDQVKAYPPTVPFLELVEDIADAVGAAVGEGVPFRQGLRPCDGGRR